LVPNSPGSTAILQTPVYDCSSYKYVTLKFSHICKVSPLDIVRIEYRKGAGGGMGSWDTIPVDLYLGSATDFKTKGFSAASYPEWQAGDSTVFPSLSWWKEEAFELQSEAGFGQVQFRFVIKHGQQFGTQASYGWLIDNFQLLAANYEIYPPVVEFIPPFAKDTVYFTGPWTINAKVKGQSGVGIVRPYLKYTATENGTVVKSDSILMDNVRGDSLWQATVPQFVLGTEVLYSITGIDSVGNEAWAMSKYIIGKWNNGLLILQDGSTSSDYYPFGHNWGYSRSMSLYPAAEMEPKVAGQINTVSLRVSQAGNGAFPMKVWLKTVPASKTAWDATTDILNWSVVTQDAILVYDGLFHFSSTGWFDIPLTNVFNYNGTDNLVVMFEQDCSGYGCNEEYMTTYSKYYHSSTATNTFWRAHRAYTPPVVGDGAFAISAYRPDLRINVTGNNNSNSVAIHSIDINDTAIISPGNTTPLLVTIKNQGSTNLTSADIYYSINGNIQQPYSLTGVNLPWGIDTQVKLDDYTPTMHGYDTIQVWVKMPNGVVDNANYDDTLSKIIYGSSDILMSFVDFPMDTVYDTGPFEISASIYKFSGDPVVPPIDLVVTTTFGGAQTSETLSMNFDSGTGLWKTAIPHRQFGSNVVYSITLTDKYTNTITKTDSFYIKRIEVVNQTGYVIIGTGTTTNNRTPMGIYFKYSFSRQLYFGTEFFSDGAGGLITHLAWDYASPYTWNFNNQTCYFRAVDDNDVSSSAYIDPLADGATQVWQGSIGAAGAGWVEIELDEPFLLPRGKNLLVYWNHQHGAYQGNYVWNHTTTAVNTMAYGYADGTTFSSATTTNLKNDNIRPNARFYMVVEKEQDTSVALVAIESPLISEITGGSVPVRVKIRNKGKQNLDFCKIYWTKNGEFQDSITYTRNLPGDFTDTITIADYTPVVGQRDTIVIWVSMPNGKQDSITKDDTLMLITVGCTGIVNGINNIPGDFATLGNAIQSIADCGISGKVILEIAPSNEMGTVDLSALKGILTASDTLIIRSSTGNAGDVVFTASANTPALKINGIRNLYVEHITLNAAAGTHGVEIIGRCDNVEINSCIINASTSATAVAGGCGVYYNGASSTTGMGNIRLLNNTIRNGHSGIYFSYLNPTAAEQSASTSWVRINGNTIENPYAYGLYSYYYARYDSIAYNTINTRAVSASQTGMFLANYNRIKDGVIGNKINMCGMGTTSTYYGIYPATLNHSTTGAGGYQALVANNEIRKLSSGGTFYGLTQYSNVIAYIHNSVYAEGTGTNYAMHINNTTSSTYACAIMNNLLISAGTSTTNRALYCVNLSNTAGVTMDYNDYYSTGTELSNWGATLSLLQSATQQNTHSVNINPTFLNTANNLELIDNTGITVPLIGAISNDIIGISRLSITAMGAYELLPTKHDVMLLRFASWNNDIVEGQTVQVNVDAQNLGVPVTAATFGWSVNGVNKTPYSWTASPVFGSFTQQTIPIGSFVATGADSFDVVVWVETINGQQDEENWNDTVVSTTAFIIPLAEFVSPFVDDTIANLSFDVNVKIVEGSGAPVNTPEMYIETLIDGSGSCYIHTRDTLTMVREGDKWVAKIPKQYYNSTVIYETHISDNIGNNVTLRDTVYIMYNDIVSAADYSYTGQAETIRLPRGTYQIECWGADGGNSYYNHISYGGKGGYSKGVIQLMNPAAIHIYVGQKGEDKTMTNRFTIRSAFNGGGRGGYTHTSYTLGATGGGGSDVRIGGRTLTDRIIVAGGGGGSGYGIDGLVPCPGGGNGGGINGIRSPYPTNGTAVEDMTTYVLRAGLGGTQIAGGLRGTFEISSATDGSLGQGGQGADGDGGGGGGGGGYYGGGGGCFGAGMSGGGGGGSGYIGNLSQGLMASVTEAGFIVNPVTTGDGFVRITTLSGGRKEVYAMSNNLAIFKAISLRNNDGELCAELSTPVGIELLNLGENNYDFTKDSITICYTIINPRGVTHSGSISIDTGEFFSGESMEIELMSAMPIVAGSYTIKAWVTSSIDQFVCDDTLIHIYTSSLVGLPVDEDFSNITLVSNRFVSTPILGDQIWETYTDPTSQILPPSGNGMMKYTGTYGTMAQLSTRQLDLSGVVDPELKFWYYHDATTPVSDRSYTDVNIIVDGVKSTVLSVNRTGATTGWQQYRIDLQPYKNGKCVLIQFESMNKYDANSAQYIAHLTITSTPDLAVSAIVISPELNACEMSGKELKVVLTTTVNQAIDLSGSGNNLAIHIGSQQPILFPVSKLIPGNTSDTISVATNVDLTGITNITAYLTSPVDNYSTNDTAKLIIDMRPELEVKMETSTGGTNCFLIGQLIYLEDIEVKNIGNVDLSGIKLKLLITAGDNYTETVIETKTIDLQVDSSISYRFENPYTVPQEDYRVQVTAWLECLPGSVESTNYADECVDPHDLVLIEVVNPPAGSTGTIGSMDSITISIENTDQLNSFEAINITALIKDGNGQVLNTLSGTVSRVEPSENLTFTFSEKYTVPNLPVYFIHVYFSSQDYYPKNDTAYVPRETNVGIHSTSVTNAFILGQNIPNPATNSTRIDYAIPEAGQVIFHVHTISGQLLYSQTVEAPSGTNSLELNTSTFAAGVYYYSIEYKGQKRVKRMSVTK
jgi:hypothetical protein